MTELSEIPEDSMNAGVGSLVLMVEGSRAWVFPHDSGAEHGPLGLSQHLLLMSLCLPFSLAVGAWMVLKDGMETTELAILPC